MRRTSGRFLFTWAARDARRRWAQVVSIALLIALGTGMYSAMSSMARWRLASADDSYALLRMHDLRVSLAEGSFVDAGSLSAALDSTGVPVAAAEERLVVPTQIEASARGKSTIVPGRIVGARARANVDRVAVESGSLRDGRVALERNFANHYDLPAAGRLRLAGGRTVSYSGLVHAPEYFIVTAPGADFGAESSFAVIFGTLETAQALSGRSGSVNELVVRAPRADIAELERRIAAALPGVGVTFTRRAHEPAHRLIYKDAENDQQMLDIFAYLLLGAAAFAAFNLVNRAVEAQRREIGIGMALGVSPARLAMRPMLLGLQIAVMGVALGIPVGLVANSWLAGVLRTWFPLPVVDTPFEPDMFASGAALGLVLPLAATAFPVWRAVRVAPVEAIRVGARAAKGSGLAWMGRRVRLPGGSLGNLPLRNVLRTPRRTAFTALGIGAVVAIVVALSGVMDSFGSTLAAARDEALAGARNRMTVDLVVPERRGGEVSAAVSASPAVGRAESSLRLPVSLANGGTGNINAFLEVVEKDTSLWRPTLREGQLGGLVIAEVAARDLGVSPGDEVALRHPVPRGSTFVLTTSKVKVTGIHASPFRFLVYAPASAAPSLGLGGLVNRVSIIPAAGRSETDVKRALLGVPGVAAVQHANATTDAVDKRMEQFDNVLVVTVAIALAMALLMAYNASAINADERAREHATMFAFGVRPGRVVGLGVLEAMLIGVLATATGTIAGYALLRWIISSSMPETMPDVGALLAIDAWTFAFAVVAGTVAVALAPLLTRRRLERTDIASTLRVVE